MTDDVSKLPAWPVYTTRYLDWLQLERDAYRARMEALASVLRQIRSAHLLIGVRNIEAVDALLAACEREEG